MKKDSENKTALITRAYTEMKNDVLSYFTLYTHDVCVAEDMVQDLFLCLLDYTDMIVDETARSFVFTIAKRMVIDDARRQAFIRRATSEYKLKAEVYRMARFDELTADEMTERLHISKRTVEYHLYVSRKEMRKTLREAIGL